MQTSSRRIKRRQLLYLGVLGLAVFLLLPHLLGFHRVLNILRGAQPVYVILSLLAEVSRYFISAASTLILARLFDRRVPFLPMTEAFFASSAANRIFSTGGAPGMLIRLLFLGKHNVSAGAVATIYLIEDIAGLAVGSIVFFAGIWTLATKQTSANVATNTALIASFASLALTAGLLYALRYRATIERIAHWLALKLDALAARITRRPFYSPARVQHLLDDFYAGLALARRAPRTVALVFILNVVRHAAGLAVWYFAFFALGQTIAPGILILIYTLASVLSTTSAVPGEVAIMGTGSAILFLSFGVSPDAALLALLLSRAIAFWLPLPIGLLALWRLRRQHDL